MFFAHSVVRKMDAEQKEMHFFDTHLRDGGGRDVVRSVFVA